MRRVYWPTTPLPGNVGDIITPFILKACGIQFQHAPPISSRKMLGCGSIIRFAKPSDYVWGSGIIDSDDHWPVKEIEYLAVRGPITAQRIFDLGGPRVEIFGDPGLMMPMFHDRPMEKKYKVGYVPHYVDYDIVCNSHLNVPRHKIINPLTDDPRTVIN